MKSKRNFLFLLGISGSLTECVRIEILRVNCKIILHTLRFTPQNDVTVTNLFPYSLFLKKIPLRKPLSSKDVKCQTPPSG